MGIPSYMSNQVSEHYRRVGDFESLRRQEESNAAAAASAIFGCRYKADNLTNSEITFSRTSLNDQSSIQAKVTFLYHGGEHSTVVIPGEQIRVKLKNSSDDVRAIMRERNLDVNIEEITTIRILLSDLNVQEQNALLMTLKPRGSRCLETITGSDAQRDETVR